MTLETLMRRDVVTAAPETGVVEIAASMAEENVGSVVVTEEGEPVGVVTDRDLATQVVGDGAAPADVTAGDVMTADPATAPASAGLYQLTEMLQAASVRRMPVVDDGRLVGIITLDDVNQLVVDELANLGAVIEAESPPY